jgi:hypothetical protein
MPKALGDQTSTLSINANAATQTLTLTGTGAPLVNPRAAVTPVSGSTATAFMFSVSALTPGGQVALYTSYVAASGMPDMTFAPTTWTADASGNLVVTATSDSPGSYDNWFIDITTGISSNHVVHDSGR